MTDKWNENAHAKFDLTLNFDGLWFVFYINTDWSKMKCNFHFLFVMFFFREYLSLNWKTLHNVQLQYMTKAPIEKTVQLKNCRQTRRPVRSQNCESLLDIMVLSNFAHLLLSVRNWKKIISCPTDRFVLLRAFCWPPEIFYVRLAL